MGRNLGGLFQWQAKWSKDSSPGSRSAGYHCSGSSARKLCLEQSIYLGINPDINCSFSGITKKLARFC